MNAPEDRIWQGIRAHLDALGSMSTVPPIGNIRDRRRPRWSALAVAVLASAGVMALAVGLLLPGLLAVKPPLTGATPYSSSTPTSPHATPVDWSALIGQTYVAVDITEAGQPVAIVSDTRLVLGFGDASHFGANAGCNYSGGDYQIQDARLVTANVYMTLKGCLGELGRQEGWYYMFLQSSPAISPNTTGLVLTGGDTVVTFLDQRFASPSPSPSPTAMPSSEFGPATWALDPAFPPPDPTARDLHILVWERACASGKPTTGRMSEPLVAVGPTSVTITIGVRPLPGAQECPGPPGTPTIVTLPEPLGSRDLLDGGNVPPAPPRAPY